MFKCILCENDFDDKLKTEEHIFPESIGGIITIWELCKTCNDHLGSKVDSHLSNHWYISLYRFLLKLPGKDGEIPNPFGEGVLSSDPSQKIRYLTANGLPAGLYTVPQKTIVSDTQTNQVIKVILDSKDADKKDEIIDKIKTRAEKKIGKSVNIEVLEVFEDRIQNPSITFEKSLHDFNWQRDIIKIAYELTYRHLGIKYLSSPTAHKIRQLLLLDEITLDDLQNSKIHGTLDYAINQNSLPFIDDPNSIQAALLYLDGKLNCLVRIFDVFHCGIVTEENINGDYHKDSIVIRIDVKNKRLYEMPFLKYVGDNFK